MLRIMGFAHRLCGSLVTTLKKEGQELLWVFKSAAVFRSHDFCSEGWTQLLALSPLPLHTRLHPTEEHKQMP